MELTINTFTKGLQSDTHPMMTSNDTLTDCLNGTILTQNGNEIILLNDMGNRRIDNAFLPSGYLPVGMKEYGGIIYVAAYNPITNKSQIGSFPSPERKINSNDSNNLGGKLEESDFLKNISLTDGLNFLSSDVMLIPLTLPSDKEIVPLHAGDKFTVYTTDNSTFWNDVSNRNNEGADDLNKNKLYTLALGILNSQNEFVDITSSLARWKKEDGKWNIVDDKEFEEKSEKYRFNYGYFIPIFNSDDNRYSIDDEKLLSERNTIEANTYSYKLVGPLYLKYQLNHVLTLNYNIYGNKTTNDNEYSITIDATITYNCPNPDFDFYWKEGDSYVTSEATSTLLNFPFNEETGLYTINISKTYVIYSESKELNYQICVCSGLEYENGKVYLKEPHYKGVLNLDLLNSGTVKLTDWRFSNNIESEETILSYSFDIYPKPGQSFKDLTLELIPYTINGLQSSEAICYYLGDLDGGNFIVTLYWNLSKQKYVPSPFLLLWSDIGLQLMSDIEKPIEFRKLYKVNIYYREVNNYDISLNYKKLEESYWLLTTELLNNCYLFNSDEFVHNYCYPTTDEENILDTYLKLNPLNYFTITETGTYSTEEDGSMIVNSSSPSPYEYSWKYTYTGLLKLNNSTNLLYPDCILVNLFPSIEILNNDNIDRIDNENVSYTYVWKDIAKASNLETNGTIEGLFEGINSNEITNGTDKFSIGVVNKGLAGHRDFHALVTVNREYFDSLTADTGEEDYIRNFETDGNNDNAGEKYYPWDFVDSRYHDGPVYFKFSDYESELLAPLSDLLYAYGFGNPVMKDNGDRCWTINYFSKGLTNNILDKSYNKGRLWWRTELGEYALYDDLVDNPGPSGDPNPSASYSIRNLHALFNNIIYRKRKDVSTFSLQRIGILKVNEFELFDNKSEILNLKYIKDNPEEPILNIPENTPFTLVDIDETFEYETPIFEGSSDFLDYVLSFPTNYIQNAYINNSGKVILTDANNYLLDTNSVYEIKNDNKLYKVNEFKMSTEINLDESGNYNGIVFCPTKKSSPKLRYNLGWTNNNDLTTYLMFDSVYVMPKTVTTAETETETTIEIQTGGRGNSISGGGHIVPKVVGREDNRAILNVNSND